MILFDFSGSLSSADVAGNFYQDLDSTCQIEEQDERYLLYSEVDGTVPRSADHLHVNTVFLCQLRILAFMSTMFGAFSAGPLLVVPLTC